MFIEKLKDLWICSCGNWVDNDFVWCPDCCREKLELIDEPADKKESIPRILS